MAMKDLRRSDLRGQTLANAVWLTSAEIDVTCDDAEAVLFSFPKPNMRMLIQDIFLDISEAFVGGTPVLNIGSGTLATDAAVDGDTVTVVDADDYIPTANLTLGTIGMYPATSGDFKVALTANTYASPQRLIEGADAIVPCIYVALTSDAALTAGKARVKMLVSYLDGI